MKEQPNKQILNYKATEGSLIKSIKNLFKSFFGYSNNSFEESVDDLIEEYNSSSVKIGKEEREMLHNILSFGELKVCDVMVPRTDIIAVDEKISPKELKEIFIKQEHTRMPVYKDSLDNVIGFIHIKDLLIYFFENQSFNLSDLTRELLIISPSMKVIDLLIKMRKSRVHMALVLDEYGGTDGLVTIEDLMEEIVGEIQDEHDDMVDPEIILLDENTIEASARLPIEKLAKYLNIDINYDHNDFDTIGGLVISMIGYIPHKGEKIIHPSNIEFEVLDSDARKIKRILITKINNLDNNDEQD